MQHSKLSVDNADEMGIIFYESFMQGDIDVMAALWSKENCICVHPGSSMIMGYEFVMRSWKHIFENSLTMDIRYRIVNKLITDDIEIHIVIEDILENKNVIATISATNIYKRFENGWLMVEHHASLVNTGQIKETLQ